MIMLFSIVLISCSFDEELPHQDLRGTIRLPKEASQFLFGVGEEQRVIDDVRGMGPVYLGAFPSVQEGLYPYTHPEMGPIVNEGQDGNTYPYGGNTLGRFDWACYQSMVCKTVTGRYNSYADFLDFHNNVLEQPLLTAEGHEVTSVEEFQERCFEVLYSTGDQEMLFIQGSDFEEDGEEWVAEVEIPHVFFKEGMSVWGWIDMPSVTFDFNTCNATQGAQVNYYDQRYELGTNYSDLLNFPGKYIDNGDWVAQEAEIITDPGEDFDLEIGYQYVEE
jgi:hypothetical protein